MPLDDFEIRGITAEMKTAADTVKTIKNQYGEVSARVTNLEQHMAGGDLVSFPGVGCVEVT